MAADHLDYAFVLRRIDPDSQLGGILNLDLDIGADGATFGAPDMSIATGRLDFDLCTEDLGAGILDLWATNIVLALLPTLDPENESKLNCIIGRFNLAKGVLTPETLGLDTTTMRMMTEGTIDLAANTIDLTMTPFPKRAQLLSVEAPIGIKGSLTEPEIAMGALPVTSTIARMAKNIALFPVKRVAGEKLPEDGSDICPCVEGHTPVAAGEGSEKAPEIQKVGEDPPPPAAEEKK